MSQKRKIQKQCASLTLTADDFLVESDDGEMYPPRAGEWIRLAKRVPMKLLRIAGRLDRLQDSEDTRVSDIEALFDALLRTLSPLIIDWNWSDRNAEPNAEGEYPRLPTPAEDPEILWELDEEEVLWILDKQNSRTAAPDPT